MKANLEKMMEERGLTRSRGGRRRIVGIKAPLRSKVAAAALAAHGIDVEDDEDAEPVKVIPAPHRAAGLAQPPATLSEPTQAAPPSSACQRCR